MGDNYQTPTKEQEIKIDLLTTAPRQDNLNEGKNI